MTDNEPDPVARLRAADPARDTLPRAGFSDEVLERATGPEAEVPAQSVPTANLDAERIRRRPRWLTVAAVAASVAIVGAAGYSLGSTTGGSSNLADGAAPPISLQNGGNPEGMAQGGRETATGQDTAVDSSMSDSIYPEGYGRTHFTASGLGTGTSTAQAYAFDPNAASSADYDVVAGLATALGIASPAELRDGSWTAGPQDGSAPSLSVSLNGILSFYYQNPKVNPWVCEESIDGDSDLGPCMPTGTAPSEDAAIEALRSLVVAAGRDPATFVFTSRIWEGSTTRYAEAVALIDGQRLDQSWSLEMAEEGIMNAYGAVADVIELGMYPVVSEQEGFERLSDPRFGSASRILPIAIQEKELKTREYVPPTAPPATPDVGASLSWPVHDVEIVSARLGLASQWQPDGSVLVVPAYEFTDADGGTWSVIAVADTRLDFTSD